MKFGLYLNTTTDDCRNADSGAVLNKFKSELDFILTYLKRVTHLKTKNLEN